MSGKAICFRLEVVWKTLDNWKSMVEPLSILDRRMAASTPDILLFIYLRSIAIAEETGSSQLLLKSKKEGMQLKVRDSQTWAARSDIK
jgi:hypothetical protein